MDDENIVEKISPGNLLPYLLLHCSVWTRQHCHATSVTDAKVLT